MTISTGDYSHAEGFYTRSVANDSHAEGCYTGTHGTASHAEGYKTSASSAYQHVEGKYNISDSAGIYALIIGNGTGEYELRSNALTVSWTGNLWVSGNVEDGAGNILSNMAKKDLSNLSSHTTIDTSTPVDFVIKYVAGSTSWYRIWKSGWVEQGGIQKTKGTVTLPIQMTNADYSIAGHTKSTWENTNNPTGTSVRKNYRQALSSKTASSFKTDFDGNWDFTWYICGQGDPTAIAAILQGE